MRAFCTENLEFLICESLYSAEERINVSRRQALLAALAFTVPSSHFFQRKRDFQALAVEYVMFTHLDLLLFIVAQYFTAEHITELQLTVNLSRSRRVLNPFLGCVLVFQR